MKERHKEKDSETHKREKKAKQREREDGGERAYVKKVITRDTNTEIK